MTKRVMDITVSALALFFLSPLLLTIAIVQLLVNNKTILFKQVRPGLNGNLFTIYKFSTMNNQCDQLGNLLPDEQRVTALGLWLRKLSLDELPQLVNVLKGELSLVGPRPLLVEYLPLYNKEQAKRHLVKPGITGWAQINGRNAISWQDKLALDTWYVEHQSFMLDIKILLMTVKKVFKKEGVSQAGRISVEKFSGNN